VGIRGRNNSSNPFLNLNLALEKAVKEPKKAIVEANLKILIKRLHLPVFY